MPRVHGGDQGHRPSYGGVRHDLRRGHGGLYEHAARARSAAQQRAAHSLTARLQLRYLRPQRQLHAAEARRGYEHHRESL